MTLTDYSYSSNHTQTKKESNTNMKNTAEHYEKLALDCLEMAEVPNDGAVAVAQVYATLAQAATASEAEADRVAAVAEADKAAYRERAIDYLKATHPGIEECGNRGGSVKQFRCTLPVGHEGTHREVLGANADDINIWSGR